MLDWLKRKLAMSDPQPRPQEGTPRGILPTFVGDGEPSHLQEGFSNPKYL